VTMARRGRAPNRRCSTRRGLATKAPAMRKHGQRGRCQQRRGQSAERDQSERMKRGRGRQEIVTSASAGIAVATRPRPRGGFRRPGYGDRPRRDWESFPGGGSIRRPNSSASANRARQDGAHAGPSRPRLECIADNEKTAREPAFSPPTQHPAGGSRRSQSGLGFAGAVAEQTRIFSEGRLRWRAPVASDGDASRLPVCGLRQW